MSIKISGLISGLDTDSMVKELVSAYSIKKDNFEKAQTKLSWKQDAWKDMNSKIYSFYSKSLSDMRFASAFNSQKKTTLSDETKASVSASSTVANGTQTLEITQLATAGYLTGAKLDIGVPIGNTTKLSQLGVTDGTIKLNVSGTEKSINVTDEMSVSELVTALKSTGVNASFDTTQQRFFINSTKSGAVNDFSVISDAQSEQNIKSLGLFAGTGVNDATKQVATNAIIELNGAVFETDSNTATINGLTISAKAVTDGVISLTTETDVDGIYDMVKNFITEYNTLINGMDVAFNATSAKKFEPLTSDEKEEMTEAEIEKWETKIKDALLRRDSTLDSVSSTLKNTMQTVYEIDGEKYSLSSFGINTLGYFVSAENEKNAYHIAGDKEDSSVSSSVDKLKAAIIENPDKVMDFFNNLAKDLYKQVGDKMKSTTLSSSFTVYNDKQMQSEYDDYTKKISEWEEKVADMEDYYYNKFSEMETALSKLESSTSALSSLLGS